MKTILSSLLILFSISFSSAQVIPNASFENWHAYALGEYPDSWMTDDSVAAALGGGNAVFKDTDAYSGTYSIHMKSVSALGINGPGVATNGIITQSGASFIISGGSPDTARSRVLSGWYKYSPKSANDYASVSAYLFWDSLTVRDTIAAGIINFTDTVSAYQMFTLNLIFNNWTKQPTTCLIVMQSSPGINDPNLAVGSELIVDSLNFSGYVGVEELYNVVSSVNIYPTPADQMISVDVELKNNIIMNYFIYDVNGKLVGTGKMNSEKEKINVSNLSSGSYFFKLGDLSNRTLYTRNFSISR